jgi:hypothetical protein
MPGYGGDASWAAVLGEASIHKWFFGRDIIFTAGPLSSIYTHWFQLDSFARDLAINTLLIISYALLFAVLALQARRVIAIVLAALAPALYAPEMRQIIFLAYPLLLSLVILAPERGTLQRIAVGLGLIACASVTLAKFLVAPSAIVSFVFCDCILVIRRRWPWCTTAYVLTYFLAFAWLEGFEPFLQYVFDSISVVSGYSEAMGLEGSSLELAAFLICGAVFLGNVGLCEGRASREAIIDWRLALARWLVFAANLFTVYKLGFVRHDLHSLAGWSGLGLAALIYVASRRHRSLDVMLVCSVIAALALLVLIPVVTANVGQTSALGTLRDIPWWVGRQLSLAAEFVSNPGGSIAGWQRAKEEGWLRVRAAQYVPPVEGSVDVIGSIQSSLLAHGLNYRPRYTVQEYAAYTRRLIEANRRSLTEPGLDFLFFDLTPTDGRFPALSEGPLWPDILAAYEPELEEGRLLVLRRRMRPVDDLLRAGPSETVQLGRAFVMPDVDAPQFLKASIGKTPLGRLIELLFRPPPVEMILRLSDGSWRRYRAVTAIVEAGFLITPIVTDAHDFLLVAKGESAPLPRVSEVIFDTSDFGRYVYRADIRISLSSVLTGRLRREIGEAKAARQTSDGSR